MRNTSTTSLPPDKEGSPPEQAGHQKQQAAKSMVMVPKMQGDVGGPSSALLTSSSSPDLSDKQAFAQKIGLA